MSRLRRYRTPNATLPSAMLASCWLLSWIGSRMASTTMREGITRAGKTAESTLRAAHVKKANKRGLDKMNPMLQIGSELSPSKDDSSNRLSIIMEINASKAARLLMRCMRMTVSVLWGRPASSRITASASASLTPWRYLKIDTNTSILKVLASMMTWDLLLTTDILLLLGFSFGDADQLALSVVHFIVPDEVQVV